MADIEIGQPINLLSLLSDAQLTKYRHRVYRNNIEWAFNDLARTRGYKRGVWVLTDSFPGIPLQIGWGFYFDPRHKVLLVAGCTDKDGKYYSAVPIFQNKVWAKIINHDNEKGNIS